MHTLAILPARSGSKRLPGKNVRLLAGKPLINHTAEVIRDCFDRLIVSSDAPEILELVDTTSNVETQLRPATLATDTSKVIDTVAFHFEQNDTGLFDQIWLCLPTCPLRTREDVRKGQSLLTKEFDGVISITEYEFPPSLALTLSGGVLQETDSSAPFANGNSRSQDHISAFHPNGAFYGMWWESFRTYRNFFRGRITGSIMPRSRSIDIDTLFDFNLASLLVGFGREQGDTPEQQG